MKERNRKANWIKVTLAVLFLTVAIVCVILFENPYVNVAFIVLPIAYYLYIEISSVTSLRNKNVYLQTKAETDDLTGLYSLKATRNYINQILENDENGEEGKLHALYMIDIDDFKEVNDNFGHYEGDRTIEMVAHEIKRLFRASDIVGRIGGDEFVVFLKNAGDMNFVKQKAEDLCKSLQFLRLGEKSIAITCSIGVTVCSQADSDSKDYDALYREADAAMYKSKSLGKNRYEVFDDIPETDVGEVPLRKEPGEDINKINIQLTALLECMDSGVLLFEMGDEIRCVYVSPSYCKMCGKTEEELCGPDNGMLQTMPPDDRQKVEEALREGAETGEIVDVIYRNIAGDKEGCMWCNLRAGNIPYGNSELPVMICVVVNVTQLKEQEQNLKLAFEQTSLKMWEFDIVNNVLDGSKFGIMHRDLPQSHIESGFVHKDSVEEYIDFFDSIFRGEESGTCVAKLNIMGIEYEWYRITYRNVFDEHGKAYKAVGVVELLPNIGVDKIKYEREEQIMHALEGTLMFASKRSLNAPDTYSKLYDAECKMIDNPEGRAFMKNKMSRSALISAYNRGERWLETEYRRIDGEGNVMWVSGTVKLLREPISTSIYAYLYLQDIDRRKKWETELSIVPEYDPETNMYTYETLQKVTDGIIEQQKKDALHSMMFVNARSKKRISGETRELSKEDFRKISRFFRMFFDGRCVLGCTQDRSIVVFMPDIENENWATQKARKAVDIIRLMLDETDVEARTVFSIGLSFAKTGETSFDDMYEDAVSAAERSRQDLTMDRISIYDKKQNKAEEKSDLYRTDGIFTEEEVVEPDKLAEGKYASIIKDCLDALVKYPDISDALDVVFKKIARYYRSERVFSLRLDEETKTVECTHEWFSKNKHSFREYLDGLELTKLPVVERAYKSGRIIYLHQASTMKVNPIDIFGARKAEGSWNYITVPIIIRERITGFVCIENPKIHYGDADIVTLLLPLIASEIEKREMISEEEEGAYAETFIGQSRESAADESDTKGGLLPWAAGDNTKANMSIYLQPRVNMLTGEVCGFETLLRGLNGDKVLTSEGEYFEDDMVREAELFALEETLKTMQRWKDSGKAMIPCSISYSRNTLLDRATLASTLAVWSRYDVPIDMIEISIADTTGSDEETEIVEACSRFSEQGIGLALDDFGSFYSGVLVPPGIKLATIKMDKRITGSFILNKRGVTIAKQIIDACKDIGVECIAKGVETEEQKKILCEVGGVLAEGELFGEPCSVQEFEKKYIV